MRRARDRAGRWRRSSLAGQIFWVLDAGPIRMRERAEPGLRSWLVAARDWLDANLRTHLPEPDVSLAAGMVLGARTGLPSELRATLAKTGITHLTAVSGLNVALVAGGVLVLARRVLGAQMAVAPTLVAVWLYALLVGAPPSALRAAAMLTVGLAAQALGRLPDPAVGLALAVAALLAWEPSLAFDLGFQLSVAATAGLVPRHPRSTRLLAGCRGGYGSRNSDARGAACDAAHHRDDVSERLGRVAAREPARGAAGRPYHLARGGIVGGGSGSCSRRDACLADLGRRSRDAQPGGGWRSCRRGRGDRAAIAALAACWFVMLVAGSASDQPTFGRWASDRWPRAGAVVAATGRVVAIVPVAQTDAVEISLLDVAAGRQRSATPGGQPRARNGRPRVRSHGLGRARRRGLAASQRSCAPARATAVTQLLERYPADHGVLARASAEDVVGPGSQIDLGDSVSIWLWTFGRWTSASCLTWRC